MTLRKFKEMNKRTIKERLTPYEKDEAKVLVKWCNLQGIPIIHIANEGKRSYASGKSLKEQGLMKGVSDYFLPFPRGNSHGLWLELKRNTKASKPTKEQMRFLMEMGNLGYASSWCRGFDEAVSVINKYIEFGPSKNE